MRSIRFAIFALCVLLAVSVMFLFLRPFITHYTARQKAIKDCESVIDPYFIGILNLPQVEMKLPIGKAGSMHQVTLGGYQITVPQPLSDKPGETWHDFEYPTFKVRIIEPIISWPELDTIVRDLKMPGRFALIKAARNAKYNDISKLPTTAAINRHEALLRVRSDFTRVGSERLFAWFDRGDLKGFIDGDLTGKKPFMLVDVIEPTHESWFFISIQNKGPATLSDAQEFLATLQITPAVTTTKPSPSSAPATHYRGAEK